MFSDANIKLFFDSVISPMHKKAWKASKHMAWKRFLFNMLVMVDAL